jgi:hypothetical protein
MEYAENWESCKSALPFSLAKDVGEWSGSGSGSFISDVLQTEVLRLLDVTTVLIINY